MLDDDVFYAMSHICNWHQDTAICEMRKYLIGRKQLMNIQYIMSTATALQYYTYICVNMNIMTNGIMCTKLGN